MTGAERLLALAQDIANERPTLFISKGPGVGDKDTNAFVSELRRRAHATFGADHAEQTICGASGLRVDYYFPEDETIVEVAFLLRNSPSEFEKDILKAIMAQENGQPVSQLVFIAKPGAVKRCNARIGAPSSSGPRASTGSPSRSSRSPHGRRTMLPSIDPVRSVKKAAVALGKGWIYELKLDGFRGVLSVENGRGFFTSKTAKSMKRFQPLADAIAPVLKATNAILDGEIIVMGDEGPDFYALMLQRAEPAHAAFLLWLNGKDVRAQPL